MLYGSQLVISSKAKKQHGSISCLFSGELRKTYGNVLLHYASLHSTISITEILRDDDYSVSYTTAVESTDSYVLKHSDFVDVKCESKNGKE